MMKRTQFDALLDARNDPISLSSPRRAGYPPVKFQLVPVADMTMEFAVDPDPAQLLPHDHVRTAQVLVACTQLEPTLGFPLQQLGFVVDAIFPGGGQDS